MIAEIVSVGTELLLGQIVDTNAAYMAQLLARLGISVYFRSTVGDNPERLRDTLRLAFSRADLVVTIGGLGPTADDLTKEAVADILNVRLVEDPEHSAWLRRRAEERGWGSPAPSFFKQALVPENGRGLPNPNGTALGAFFDKDGKLAACLPGPPGEFIPMAEESLEPHLREKLSGRRLVIRSRTLRMVGIGESSVEEIVLDLMDAANPTVAPYAKVGEVHLRVTARAETEEAAERLIEPVAAEIRRRLGDWVYGTDEQTLEEAVVRLLQSRRLTLAVAESCTGGLISKRITNVPDASHVFGLGLVTYSNEAKTEFLGVPAEMIAAHGAVSPEVARAMAAGARTAGHADLAVSVTGIAGPGGGTPEKPVGTIHIGLAWSGGVISEHTQFLGGRQDVTARAAQTALALVRRYLLRPDDPPFAAGGAP